MMISTTSQSSDADDDTSSMMMANDIVDHHHHAGDSNMMDCLPSTPQTSNVGNSQDVEEQKDDGIRRSSNTAAAAIITPTIANTSTTMCTSNNKNKNKQLEHLRVKLNPSPTTDQEEDDKSTFYDSSSDSTLSSKTQQQQQECQQEKEQAISLSFESFIDLQTRLVLLPHQDSDCLGAVIASYQPPPTLSSTHANQKENNSNHESNADEENKEEKQKLVVSDRSLKNENDDEETINDDKAKNEESNVKNGNNDVEKKDDDNLNNPDVSASTPLTSNANTEQDQQNSPADNKNTNDDYDDENDIHNTTNESISIAPSMTTIPVESEKDSDEDESDEDNDQNQETPEDATSATMTPIEISPNKENGRNSTETEISPPPVLDVVGCLLTSIPYIDNAKEEQEQEDKITDWTNADFTSILSSIRDAPTPILLTFQRPKPTPIVEQDSSINHVDLNEMESISDSRGGSSYTMSQYSQSYTDGDSHDGSDSDDEEEYTDRDTVSSLESMETTSTDYSHNKEKSKVIESATSNAFSGFKRWGSSMRVQAEEAANRARNAVEKMERERIEKLKLEEERRQRYFEQQEKLREEEKKKKKLEEERKQKELEERQQEEQQQEQKVEEEEDRKETLSKESNTTDDSKENATPETPLDTTVAIEGTKNKASTPSPTNTRPSSPSSKSTTTIIPSNKSNHVCGLYLQTTSGKCMPIQDVGSNSSTHFKSPESKLKMFRKSPPTITNTSVLVVRSSAHKPCPSIGYHYQWYRSCSSTTTTAKEESEEENNDSSNSECEETDIDGVRWMLLDGATSFIFQPSATDIGYRVKCVVRVDDDVSRAQQQQQQPGTNEESNMYTCELSYAIESDFTLFKAAMRTFIPEGNTPGLEISTFKMRYQDDCEGEIIFQFTMRVVSDNESRTQEQIGLSIHQISNDAPELIHSNDPITNVTVLADPSHPKFFTLFLPTDVISTSPKLSTFCKDNQLRLQAPSRLGRESFLLAMGIAMFSGHISGLNPKTLLFRHIVQDTPIAQKEEKDVEEQVETKTIESDAFSTEDTTTYDSETESIDRSLSINTPSGDEIKSPFCTKMLAIESELENDMQLLLNRLQDKNKTVSDLQMKLQQAHEEAEKSKVEYQDCYKSLRLGEKRIESLQSDMARMKGDFKLRLAESEEKFRNQSKSSSEHEKILKALTNEKAVLSAAVEARDSKLTRMSDLQKEVEALKKEVQEGNLARHQLSEMNTKYKQSQADLVSSQKIEEELKTTAIKLESSLEQTNKDLEGERKKSASWEKKAEDAQKKFLKVKAEKNSFKQKADSLAKEMSRICKNGMGIKDIEKLIYERELMKTEVSLLRSQKRKALEESQEYKTSYENSLQAQEKAGINGEAMRALEQRIELERVIAELTEYVNAKEMQLGTMREVNQTLTEEIHVLAKTNLAKNDV